MQNINGGNVLDIVTNMANKTLINEAANGKNASNISLVPWRSLTTEGMFSYVATMISEVKIGVEINKGNALKTLAIAIEKNNFEESKEMFETRKQIFEIDKDNTEMPDTSVLEVARIKVNELNSEYVKISEEEANLVVKVFTLNAPIKFNDGKEFKVFKKFVDATSRYSSESGIDYAKDKLIKLVMIVTKPGYRKLMLDKYIEYSNFKGNFKDIAKKNANLYEYKLTGHEKALVTTENAALGMEIVNTCVDVINKYATPTVKIANWYSCEDILYNSYKNKGFGPMIAFIRNCIFRMYTNSVWNIKTKDFDDMATAKEIRTIYTDAIRNTAIKVLEVNGSNHIKKNLRFSPNNHVFFTSILIGADFAGEQKENLAIGQNLDKEAYLYHFADESNRVGKFAAIPVKKETIVSDLIIDQIEEHGQFEYDIVNSETYGHFEIEEGIDGKIVITKENNKYFVSYNRIAKVKDIGNTLALPVNITGEFVQVKNPDGTFVTNDDGTIKEVFEEYIKKNVGNTVTLSATKINNFIKIEVKDQNGKIIGELYNIDELAPILFTNNFSDAKALKVSELNGCEVSFDVKASFRHEYNNNKIFTIVIEK